MKLKIILIFLFVISLSAKTFSQAVDENSLPANVKKAFNDRFKITGTADWEKSDSGYTAEFFIGNFKCNAIFKEDGSFVKSDNETDPETVPDVVKNYVNDNFKGLKIDYARKYEFADKKDNYYYITAPKVLKDGKKYIPEFEISTQGKLITETVPPELEPYRTKPAPIAKNEVNKSNTPRKPTGKTTPAAGSQQAKKGTKVTKAQQSSDNSIPQAATDNFNKKFKLATDVKWDTQENGYVANFIMKAQKSHAYYAKDGNFEKVQSEVNPKTLLPSIDKTLTTYYPDQKVVSALNTVSADNQKYYEIQLTPKKNKQPLITTVWTSMTGQVIKEILPEAANKEEESEIAENTIPEVVVKAFNTKYPKIPNVKWEKSDANYNASFFLKGDKMIAEYTDAGEWLQSTKVIPAAKLPPPVLKFIQDKHGSEKIITTQYIENSEKQKYYHIETRIEARKNKPGKTSKLKVSAAGKLIEDVSDNDEPEIQPAKDNDKKSNKVSSETPSKSQEDIDKENKENQIKAQKKAEEDAKKAAEEQQKLDEKAKKEEEKKLREKEKEDENIDKKFDKDFNQDTLKKPQK